MSVKIMTRVFDTVFPYLSFQDGEKEVTLCPSTVKLVMLAIADSCDDEGDNSYNGVVRLAKKTNLSKRSIIRATKALVDAGYLYRQEERSRLGTIAYQINLSMLEGQQSNARSKMGRPTKEKVCDSEPKVCDSEPKVCDSEHPYPSLSIHNHPMQEQKKLQDKQEDTSPAKKETNKVRPEEKYKKRTEEAVFASMSNPMIAYAHYPEDLRPVMLLLETRWYLRPPPKPKKGGGSYAMWIEAGNELLDACGEFGVELLNLLREDWEAYNRENNGLAPHTVSSPRSLVNSAAGKAALLRQGIKVSQWAKKGTQPARQSRLDV